MTDVYGHPRGACAFDTPALRGLTDSAPYLHDGSAATLEAVLPVMLRAVAGGGTPPTLSSADERALVEFLRGLWRGRRGERWFVGYRRFGTRTMLYVVSGVGGVLKRAFTR